MLPVCSSRETGQTTSWLVYWTPGRGSQQLRALPLCVNTQVRARGSVCARVSCVRRGDLLVAMAVPDHVITSQGRRRRRRRRRKKKHEFSHNWKKGNCSGKGYGQDLNSVFIFAQIVLLFPAIHCWDNYEIPWGSSSGPRPVCRHFQERPHCDKLPRKTKSSCTSVSGVPTEAHVLSCVHSLLLFFFFCWES